MRVILGIDPSLVASGYAIIRTDQGKSELLEYSVLILSSGQPIPERLSLFFDFFQAKIEEYRIDELALETPFLGKNAQNFLKLGYLRGILLLLSRRHRCDVREFTPRQVKMAVTGYGGAEKEQVARVIQRLFPGMIIPARFDISDAIAVALCSLWSPPSSSLLR
jgi:crossover junction endodeoxyribonuclease RuvC